MPNGTGAIAARRAAIARKRRVASRTVRHSSAGGINLQNERRRSASLPARRARQDRRASSHGSDRRPAAVRLRAGQGRGLKTPLTSLALDFATIFGEGTNRLLSFAKALPTPGSASVGRECMCPGRPRPGGSRNCQDYDGRQQVAARADVIDLVRCPVHDYAKKGSFLAQSRSVMTCGCLNSLMF